MRKFTLFIASLFLALGAMAQTFVQPVTGKYYKIKGDSQYYPWVTANTNASGSVAVSANEADAAVFEKTANGFKAVSTGKYLGYTNGKFGYGATEITVELVNTGNQANNEGKYAIKSGNNWMYNNNTDGIVHESSSWLDIERLWGFIEVVMEEQPVLISRADWGVTASSQETSGDPGQATNAIDGSNSTFWHTVYAETYPHWIEFDMTKSYTVYSFDYVSRFDNTNSNGNILNYKLYVSNSAMNGNYDNATLAASGTFVYGQGVNHLINLETPVAGRYVALVAESGTRGNWSGNAAANAANCAEFNVYGIEVTTETNEAAKAALAEKIAQAEALLAAITIGDGVGEYSCGGYTEAEVESLFGSAKGFYNSITPDTEVASIEAYIEFINETIALCSLNMPVAGNYYRIKAVAGWNDDAPYLTSTNTTVAGKTTRAAFAANADASTIFYFDGNQLVSYASGHYLVKDANNMLGYNGVQTAGSKIGFRVATNGLLGAYNISFDNGNRYLYVNQSNYTDAAGTSITDANGYCFNLEPVTELPVTVTAAGYATFYAPVSVEVPAGVTAHTVTINGEWATLSEESLTVIPANTGVVLVGAGLHDLAITTTAATATSVLEGTTSATYIAEDAYVLGVNAENVVGFYTATKNQQGGSSWLNNSHKAYLPKTAGMNAASYSFRFGEGTTGIEEVKTENGNVKTVYDLTGRRVEEITAPGIYIVGGKKVLVK
ncbi:MAG: discoidin domain-containing protein [Bacteroidaceae bacterium]|nr:discoidin domain-containing protein [Bacteroidaceae bacterium]